MAGAAMMPFDGRAISDNTPGGFVAAAFIESERYKELDRRQQYYDCTQHDWKRYDFDGRIMRPGPPTSQPLLASEQANWYVPLKLRRPSSPYRLSRVIVNAFTTLVFGEQRWPGFRVVGDNTTQDFTGALVKVAGLSSKFIRARNIGGSVGTSGVSWCYDNGVPRVSVHNGKHLLVHEWENRDDHVPAHASELYRYPKDEWDPTRKKFMRNWYWYRRDWTPDADIIFQPALFKAGTEPVWTIDQEASQKHGDGVCHLEWIQNIPTDEIDGLPDYEGLYDNFDTLDLLFSVLTRGTTLNLDPTLVLKMDMDYVRRMGVKKGSDNALAVGKDGSAEYLELSGTSVEAGIKLFQEKRRAALEVAQCILPDPSEIAASGMSSVAMKVIYAPMLQKVELLREQYGTALRRMVEKMVRVAQRHYGEPVTVTDEDGNEKQVRYVVQLPPREEVTPLVDPETGNPTGEEETKLIEREPGEGANFELQWGPYFPPTPDDQSKTVTMLQLATGGKAFLAKQSAVDLMAQAFSRDATEEWKRLTTSDAQERTERMAEFGGDVGGQVGANGELPEGAQPRQLVDPNAPLPEGGVPAIGEEEDSPIELTGTDRAAIITVNEARGRKLGPLKKLDGSLDPDGALTITEFKAKRAALIAQVAQADKGAAPGVTEHPNPTGTQPPPFGHEPQ